MLALPAAAARERAPGFLAAALELPGIPAAILPADMNGDGRDELVVLVAYTGWATRSEFAPAKFDDVEGLVEVMNVVDELVDRRELRVYAAADAEGFGEPLAATDLDASVHALATGHPAEPLIALTDAGAATVRLGHSEGGAELTLTPLVESESSLSGGGRFYPDLELLRDLDGDGLPELLLPTAAGWAVHRGAAEGFGAERAALLALPAPPAEGDEAGDETPPAHELRFALEDCDGDGRLDFVVAAGFDDRGPLIYRNTGGLTFAPPVELAPDDSEGPEREVMLVGDLDGDGRAEAVDRTELERYEDPGWRQEVDEAKRPLFAYAVRGLRDDLAPEAEPRLEFEATGYTFGGSEGGDEEEIELPGGFQDLDGDGRQDLVAITLEFSILPLAMRVLVVRRISLTMNFHVWCQDGDGAFRSVPGLDLSGRFKLDLDNLKVRHLSQFAGDFDGDGRADFVQLGRGRKVTIHLGRDGCRYPVRPDRTIELRRKLRHLGLARVVDLDGDGRSDLYVVHPLKARDEQVSVPARVDLYLSRF